MQLCAWAGGRGAIYLSFYLPPKGDVHGRYTHKFSGNLSSPKRKCSKPRGRTRGPLPRAGHKDLL